MHLLSKLYFKLCVMEWGIGVARIDIKNIIREKKNNLEVSWLPMSSKTRSVADPFIFTAPGGAINILYEDFSMTDDSKYGTLRLVKLNEQLNIISDKEIMNVQSHLSYPFVFKENGKTYIIPESRKQNKVSCYEYDFKTDSLVNEKVIVNNQPLLDSTIIKYNDKYWLFCTFGDHKFEHSKLYIHYADSLSGTWQSHQGNPVKYNLKGSRPGGAIIEVDGQLYRPAQNCKDYYGQSLIINKITELTETSFKEEEYFELLPQKQCRFNRGIHTINAADGVVVIDGIRMIFDPITKLKLLLKKKIAQ